MDSGFKGFMRKLKRVHFWILCPMVILVGMICWWLAVGSIKKETEGNEQTISKLFKDIEEIGRESKHANEQVQEGMNALLDRRRSEVGDAWQMRVDQQTAAAAILTWSEELGAEFISQVKDLRPIERAVQFPPKPEKEMSRRLRRSYRDYIKDELPKLAESIGAKWLVGSGNGRISRPGRQEEGEGQPMGEGQRRMGEGQRMMPGMRSSGPSAAEQTVVGWDAANQQQLQDQHFDWSSGGRGPTGRVGRQTQTGEIVPSMLEILYAQEDLWVLRSIMRVIQQTNGDAKTRFNAAVKEIHEIEIGRYAGQTRGRVERVVAEAPTTPGRPGRPGMPGRPQEMQRGQMEGRPPGRPGGRHGGGGHGGQSEGGGGMMVIGEDPAEFRYVDENYQPLSAQDLRDALNAENVSADKAYLAVAKRIPVRLKLKVDQRKLNKLLAECASAELTIEVRQVRINAKDDGGMGSMSMLPTMPMGREGEGGGHAGGHGGGHGGQSSERGYSRGARSGNVATSTADEELFQYDVDVELYGIIYIYNPVDNKLLGIEEEVAPEQGEPAATEDDVAAA